MLASTIENLFNLIDKIIFKYPKNGYTYDIEHAKQYLIKDALYTIKEINLSIERLVLGLEGNQLLRVKSRQLVAFREMGHAIIGILSKNHSKFNKVFINLSSPNSPGYTLFKPEMNSLLLKEALFEHLMILLAGRIAEEEIFGVSITTGASNDLFEVHKLATNMIEKYGMGSHIVYPSNSEKYKILKDDDIIHLIECAYQICKNIIHKYKDLIIYTSKILIKNKIITFNELEDIINNSTLSNNILYLDE
jgi:cell division protease FtsH